MWVHLWDFNAVPLVFLSNFMAVLDCFDYHCPVVHLEVWYYAPASFVFTLYDHFSTFVCFVLANDFLASFFFSTENVIDI